MMLFLVAKFPISIQSIKNAIKTACLIRAFVQIRWFLLSIGGISGTKIIAREGSRFCPTTSS